MGRPAHPPDLVEAVGRLWRRSLSATQIGAALGLTRNAVIGIVSRYRVRDGEESWPARGSGSYRPAKPSRLNGNAHQGHRPRFAMPRRPLANPIRWLDRKEGQCAWIEDDPAERPIDELECCGQSVEAGTSWCRFHGGLVTADPEELARTPGGGGFHLRPLRARAA